ncbi:hypothetical protein RIE95_07370 [Acidithiobacillus thiooxidans]|uniref:Uncharacterized protein n=1 Tax=Acidithiobacillus sulfurivorans TaxID=1958756 RepID=A0ABS5ZWP1_9PROT|nr:MULTISPECIES: hypothetical protein [Acidithiobacillus]MBU2759538.1 hypothetical protein [Acidithiobacillus sulfurivorans]MDR7926801.1 hypothetical protein [Acidithiobacillus thiooxidans]MDX5934222.1 hypothetical protein [Acidithiobacillus thiooxidans]
MASTSTERMRSKRLRDAQRLRDLRQVSQISDTALIELLGVAYRQALQGKDGLLVRELLAELERRLEQAGQKGASIGASGLGREE